MLLASLLLFHAFALRADTLAPTDVQVKAAMLYNLGKFVTWPARSEAADQPFVIGVVGEDPFGPILDRVVSDRAIRGRKVTVRRFASAKDVAGCQILFISKSESDRIPEILRTLSRSSVLTVSEIDRFTERGGMIHFRMEENRVQFDINAAAAEAAGLAMSSQLLKLARTVVPAERRE